MSKLIIFTSMKENIVYLCQNVATHAFLFTLYIKVLCFRKMQKKYSYIEVVHKCSRLWKFLSKGFKAVTAPGIIPLRKKCMSILWKILKKEWAHYSLGPALYKFLDKSLLNNVKLASSKMKSLQFGKKYSSVFSTVFGINITP